MNAYDVALLLLEENLQTIPLNYYKKPRLAFGGVPITKEFIEQNKELYQSAQGLGMLCRGVWCLDIDINHDDNENGFESLKELEDVWPDIVKNGKQTFVQTTPRGGKHLVFKKVDGINYNQHIDYLTGVDVKAHDNNFFVLCGSRTPKGIYTANENEIQFFDGTYIDYYDGTFEDRIFSSAGTYDQQTLAKYKAPPIQYSGNRSYQPSGNGGLGKQAYQRIIDGVSVSRNDDLFKAVTYAKTCDVDIEPLKVLIGTRKGNDVFTEKEFWKTVESAMKG